MNIFLDSVGCRLNQSEIENYARQFRAAGHRLIPVLSQADMLVLNTCAVTAAASSDSRQKVRQAHRAGIAEVIVTGCWSDLEAEFAKQMPGVSRVIPNEQKDSLVSELLQIRPESYELESVARSPIPGSRLRTRAYIKAQDGCNQRCTFCVTTIARGQGRSKPINEILTDVRGALLGGAKEVVLTGVHLGSWGRDFEDVQKVKDLVEAVLSVEELPRLRLSSLEPWNLDEDFFSLWEDPRLCRHLHLPLQSGSASTLRRMARNTTPEKYSTLVNAARSHIPELAITSDVIVGFPGESNAEFKDSLDFIEAMQFSDVHVFTYSEREGTAAAKMPNAVHHFTRKERNTQVRAKVAESGRKYRRQFLGRDVDVLWESEKALDKHSWHLAGLTDNYIRVEAASKSPRRNKISPARLTALTKNGLRASLLVEQEPIWFSN